MMGDKGTGDPVIGAQCYVDHVGYLENDGTAVAPLGSTIYHKAKVDTTWSAKTSKEVDNGVFLILHVPEQSRTRVCYAL